MRSGNGTPTVASQRLALLKDRRSIGSAIFPRVSSACAGQVEAKGDRLDLGEAVRPTGEWTLYTARGRTVVEMRFQDGLIDGDYKRSFTNGQPMLNETYDRGQPVGTHTAYYRNGKLRKRPATPVSETKRRPPDLSLLPNRHDPALEAR